MVQLNFKINRMFLNRKFLKNAGNFDDGNESYDEIWRGFLIGNSLNFCGIQILLP